MTADITVARLSITHWDALRELFATSTGVAGCWCMWPRRAPGTHSPDAEANRRAMHALLEAGTSPGLIALVDEQAVGWCATGPRGDYPQYSPTNDSRTLWAIACLYVHAAADRRLVARALIEAAASLAAEHAAAAIDGPPPYWLPGDAAAIATATHTFLDNGFEQIGPGARMPELRRAI